MFFRKTNKSINKQIKPSVGIFPLLVTEPSKKVLIACITGLLLVSFIVLHPVHPGLGLVKISSRNGISMPMDTIEKTMLSKMKRKYKAMFPLYGLRYLKILEYCFINKLLVQESRKSN